jgi:hypothetical protein
VELQELVVHQVQVGMKDTLVFSNTAQTQQLLTLVVVILDWHKHGQVLVINQWRLMILHFTLVLI